ncbi:DUF4360 domain-containing protein [Actinomadura litoris]|uniref:DUF4360 domain-containing protein n=1 Tax=Actinomadura litoris TaxID=2678616 RepID=UPI001FA72021|nr:DUF4360 domain-containing protein [Actinomadura litoris]
MLKGMFVFGVAVAAVAVTAMPASAGSRLVHGPAGATLEVVSIYGSGCPVHSAQAWFKTEKDAFVVTYSSYLAQSGGSSLPIDARKNCQVRLKMNVPPGFTYAVTKANYTGWAQLQDGASATHKGSYYFQGIRAARKTTFELAGPFEDDWYFTDTTLPHQVVWRPCGEDRDLWLDTEFRVNQGTSDPAVVNFIAADSLSDGPQTFYNLIWKECK